MQGDWNITLSGEIVATSRENVDKSGRNPKYFHEFLVRAATVEGWAGASAAPAEFTVRVKGTELQQMTDHALAIGDRVSMQARANGPHPTQFYLTAVRKMSA